jgi:hypothetical protein
MAAGGSCKLYPDVKRAFFRASLYHVYPVNEIVAVRQFRRLLNKPGDRNWCDITQKTVILSCNRLFFDLNISERPGRKLFLLFASKCLRTYIVVRKDTGLC